LTSGYACYSERRHEWALAGELIRKLDVEIVFRIREVRRLDAASFSFSDLHTAMAALRGRVRTDPEVGELGSFDPIFAEFSGRSVFSLIWELHRTVPRPAQAGLSVALRASQDLADLIDEDRLQLIRPRTERDGSVWSMTRGQRSEYLKWARLPKV
jgi:hypothetical protein